MKNDSLPGLPASYTAIDFETANERERASACAVAVVRIEDGRLAAKRNWLIKPATRFSEACIAVHGIRPEAVARAPSFAEVWQDGLSEFIKPDTYLIAHNMAFDHSVLLASLAHSCLAVPGYRRNCTYQLSRKLQPGLSSYRLPFVASHFRLPVFQHHDAEADALSCARIMYRLRQIPVDDVKLLQRIQPKALKASELAKYGR
ncbi:MAG: hypothetical protein RL095_3450 [Verrucomicrobiota bacterium]|jgi:DNA polymerase-3 subunit epsilon